MREEVKTTKSIVLEEKEIDCIRTIASIECTDVACCNCPMLEDEHSDYCLRGIARDICNKNGIAYKL